MNAKGFLMYFTGICDRCDELGMEFLFRTNQKHMNHTPKGEIYRPCYVHIYGNNKNFENYYDDAFDAMKETYAWVMNLWIREVNKRGNV